jgi:hypothetical protein
MAGSPYALRNSSNRSLALPDAPDRDFEQELLFSRVFRLA